MRSLSPDERALWKRVMASVRPLRAAAVATSHQSPVPAEPLEGRPAPAAASRADHTGWGRIEIGSRARTPKPVTVVASAPPPPATLDGSWDKRLAKGMVFPDVTVDLLGHTLHSAHDLLDAALGRAIAQGHRVVLLVTGRPPRPESERPHARGAIRAAVGDWLAGSRHAQHIAAVRGAHPRHGGAGALYLILRRPRGATP